MVKRDARLGSVYRDVVLHTGVNFDDSTHLSDSQQEETYMLKIMLKLFISIIFNYYCFLSRLRRKCQ